MNNENNASTQFTSDYSTLYNLASAWAEDNIHRFLDDEMTEELIMFALMAFFQCVEFTSSESSKESMAEAKASWEKIYAEHIKRLSAREKKEQEDKDGAVG